MLNPILEYNSFIKLLEGWGLFMYDKKIAYLHYIKNRELLGNAGHVKVTQRGNSVNIEVYVREAYGILNGCYYIQNLGGNPFENKINIEEGQAVYKKKIEVNRNDGETLPYGLKIEIGKDEYLEAVWRARNKDDEKSAHEERAVQGGFSDRERERISETDRLNGKYGENTEEQNERQGAETERKDERKQEIWTDTWGTREKSNEIGFEEQGKPVWTNQFERVQEKVNQEENVQGNMAQRKRAQREDIQEEKAERYAAQDEEGSRGIVRKETAAERKMHSDMQVAERGLNGQEGGTWKSLTFSVPVETYEDKWEELCKKYEVIHPFGNREEYLSLSPKDFIIFPEKYQHLVNNSFLLHGYYNYRHVILGKKEEGGKNIYYLGVPGVYYEREKMVAIMFGFEGFECGEKRAIAGGFGYYMRRVEL